VAWLACYISKAEIERFLKKNSDVGLVELGKQSLLSNNLIYAR
jgi:hypothetical protein